MADKPREMGLLQRLMERRAAIEAGDPTGGRQLERGRNQPPVQAATTPQPVNRFRRIQELEAEIETLRGSPANRFRQAENAARSGIRRLRGR